MTLAPAPVVPWRALAGLTAAVLAAHVALLEAAPSSLGFDAPPITYRFITRTVVLNPPPANAGLAATPLAAPVPVPVPVPRRAAPGPSNGLTAPVGAAAGTAAEPTPSAAPVAPVGPAPPAATEPVPVPAPAQANEPSPAAAMPAPAAAPAATAYTVPGSVRLQYMVSGQQGAQPIAGATAELLWLQDGQKYEAQLSLGLLFRTLRRQTSTGRITAYGLAPERFVDRRRAEVAAHFERDKNRISFSANTPDAALLTGAQDRLSLFMQLSALLAGNSAAYPGGTTIAIQTAGPRDADVWVLTVGRAETLQLPYGELAAVKLTRNPRREFDQRVEAWFAPSLAYLPVKLRITDPDGNLLEQQLRAFGPP